jgi:hypothetical protein
MDVLVDLDGDGNMGYACRLLPKANDSLHLVPDEETMKHHGGMDRLLDTPIDDDDDPDDVLSG